MTCPKQHTPVMPEEVMALLNLPAGGTAIDATLGMGGHAVLMATRLEAQGHLIGIDRDRS